MHLNQPVIEELVCTLDLIFRQCSQLSFPLLPVRLFPLTGPNTRLVLVSLRRITTRDLPLFQRTFFFGVSEVPFACMPPNSGRHIRKLSELLRYLNGRELV